MWPRAHDQWGPVPKPSSEEGGIGVPERSIQSEFAKLGVDLSRVPEHIAMIMDGNGRWAQQRGMPRVMGHRQGVIALKPIVKACARLGVRVLTVYAFSTENWSRPSAEVEALMDLLVEFLSRETLELTAEGVSIRVIGAIEGLPWRVRAGLADAIASTRDQTRMTLNLAVNYGGRDEEYLMPIMVQCVLVFLFDISTLKHKIIYMKVILYS